MVLRSASLASLIALGLTTAACGEVPPTTTNDGVIAEFSDAIKGGYADTADTAVVGIFDMKSGGMCSGSLIAPNLILTAHHCVAPVLNETQGGVDCKKTNFGANDPASGFYVTTDASMSQHGDFTKVREVITPSDNDPTLNKICGYDVALLILEDNIPASAATPLVPRVDTELVANDPYYAVGYGATNDAGDGAGQRRRLDGLVIDCVGNDCPSYMGVRDSEFLGDKGICSGDSGGPALDLQNRVIGVTSRGAQGCLSPVYGYVHSWADWLKGNALHAAELGAYEPPAWATGAPTDPQYTTAIGGDCTVGSDCPSGLCMDDGVDVYCTRLCTDLAPCPEGYTCDVANTGVCVMDHPAPEEAPEPSGAGGSAPAATPKNTNNPEQDPGTSASCAIGVANTDPTKPIPWLTGFAAAVALAFARRRRA
jgi:MYXO-CTERM domain-containing protein